MTMRNYARFIPGEEISAVEQWNFSAIDTAAQVLAAQVKAREAQEGQDQVELARQQGYQTRRGGLWRRPSSRCRCRIS